jgi:hypothetical protein
MKLLTDLTVKNGHIACSHYAQILVPRYPSRPCQNVLAVTFQISYSPVSCTTCKSSTGCESHAYKNCYAHHNRNYLLKFYVLALMWDSVNYGQRCKSHSLLHLYLFVNQLVSTVWFKCQCILPAFSIVAYL